MLLNALGRRIPKRRPLDTGKPDFESRKDTPMDSQRGSFGETQWKGNELMKLQVVGDKKCG